MSFTSQRLSGKVAIVTGGASELGFGGSIAQRFANEGCKKVIITDINEAGADAVTKLNPEVIVFRKADCTKKEEWKELFSWIVEQFGGADILVNNAGWSYKNKPTLEVTEDEFERVINVNVKSIYLGCNAFIAHRLEQKKPGCIINISSVSGVRPRPGLVWYAASKANVTVATKGLAAEFGPHGIRVNCVSPLLTATPLFENFVGVPPTPENQAAFLSNVPLGRLGKTTDISAACAYLASDDAEFVTGTDLVVDGGRAV
ncbi:oxidoreductase [Atractiella rhizophila]|nr:oxidoreductase [Atractiella rhizophila]